ncbi:MAG: phosphomannomutase [Candidatus Methanomethylophilus sp.]|nr:phosphomannomutase [Methanomethylophilus sp.]MDD3232688.1 phosphomannomutase [Methanomethylophilus sp.]MDD4221544.1 phosphomannomutase [Methanomethylophilus sp.]MDD4668373.1 phosphomannomutase [Methanomethylophilus sp.]
MEKGSRLILTSTPEQEMTPENALAVGAHVGALYHRVAVGRDTAPDSRMIQSAFISGLVSAGADAVEVGIAPAPAVCVAFGPEYDAVVMIGSPNEYDAFSSIMLYNPDGSRFAAERTDQILEVAGAPLPDYREVGRVHTDHSANLRYQAQLVLSGLKANGYIILDCGCGSSSLCAPAALAAGGADVASINAHIDGLNAPRSPGLAKADLSGISDFVNASVGSIGIAYNGDATRLAVIDESGKVVSGIHVMALMLLFLRPNVAVVPFDAPALIDYAFRRDINGNVDDEKTVLQRRLIRTNGTLADITETIRHNHADLGALADGTFIFPQYSLCPDAIRASAIISQLSGVRSIRTLLASFPTYYTDSEQFHCTDTPEAFGRKLVQKLSEYDIQEILVADGWRVSMPHGSFIVATDSNNPGTITLQGESTDQIYLVTMMEQAKSIIRACL